MWFVENFCVCSITYSFVHNKCRIKYEKNCADRLVAKRGKTLIPKGPQMLFWFLSFLHFILSSTSFQTNQWQFLVCLFCCFRNLKLIVQSIAFLGVSFSLFLPLYASKCAYGHFSFKQFSGSDTVPKLSHMGRATPSESTPARPVTMRHPGHWDIRPLSLPGRLITKMHTQNTEIPQWITVTTWFRQT